METTVGLYVEKGKDNENYRGLLTLQFMRHLGYKKKVRPIVTNVHAEQPSRPRQLGNPMSENVL